ncbi:hypothetical protein PENSPDRAFT_647867 [Peniophora sp. CONT]|nr:hypothetical protein PENSPDRAFT_647867 [Peniophora sp. CONT]
MNGFESLTAMYTTPEYAAAYAAQQQQMNLQQQQQQSMQQYARANIDPQLQQMLAADSNALVNRWTYAESQPPTRTGSPPTPPPIIPPPQPNQYVFQGPPHFDFRPPQAAFTMPDPQPRVTPPPLYGPGSLSSPFSPTSFGQQPQASTSYALPPTGSSETPPPPNTDAVPGGGELARIHAEQAARAAEVEARKPDYLQRAPSGPVAGAAIGNTPLKGRRIDLLAGGGGFTHTSEESFEDRLMAGGYVGYGSTPGATAPSAPQPQARTFNEILSAHGRPPTPRANTHTSEPSPASHARDEEDENERRKRKWLTAFSEGRQKSRAEMHAVELDNVGRVLIDLAPAEKPPEIPPDDTPKRKGGRRRKRPPRRMFGPPESAALHWPDEAFPWSVRTSEMRTEEGAAQEDALGKVEHYLCSDDTEPDEDEKPFPIPPKRSIELDTYPRIKPKGGRGKSIPKKEARRRAILFPSDSGDARAALLTNSAVRRLIEVRRAEGLAICICGKGGIVNKKQVQCDDCARWYHLSCLGLTERELEDEYFCPTCVDDGRGEVEDEPQPPTLVRDGTLIGAMDGTGSDPLLFGGTSMNEDGYPRTPSPSVTEPSSQPEPPRTPAMSASLATVFDPSSTPSRGIRAKDGSGVWSNARFGGPTGSFGTPTQTATQGLGQGSVVARGTGTGAGRFSGQYVPVPQSAGAGLEDTPVDRPTLRAGTKPVVAESPLTGRGGVSGRTQNDGSPTLRAAVAQGGLGGAGGGK